MVIIEVIPSEIAKDGDVKGNAEDTLLLERVRRSLHDRLGRGIWQSVCQYLVQFKRFGRSVGRRQNLAGNVVLDGSDESALPSSRPQNPFQKKGRRALPVCARHSSDG